MQPTQGMVSHTTTGEWQSFENRMRRRRAERLALRAQAAADAGCFEDARMCLAEARGLCPGLTQLDEIERQLPRVGPVIEEVTPDAAERVETAPQPARGRRGALAAAVLVLAATAAVVAGWLGMTGRESKETGVPTTTAVAPSAPPPTPAAPASQEPSVPAVDPMPAPSSVFATETAAAPAPPPADSRPVTEPAPPPVTARAPAATRQELPTSVAGTTEPPNAGTSGTLPAPARAESLPLPRVPPPAAAPTPPANTAAIEAPPVRVLDLPAAAPPVPAAPAPEPAPVEVSQEPAVRTVLNSYAAAYSALDANAAQRVWPGVNRSALARAFDSLASQQVQLGDCRIDVSGASATATCAGTATWSPKIGGGRHSEARRWSFELARSGSGWQIVSARVQNR